MHIPLQIEKEVVALFRRRCLKMNSKWLPYTNFEDNQADEYILCLAHSGGSASVFSKWKSFMGQSVEVCPIQLPGRESRHNENFVYDFYTLVDEISSNVTPLINKPFSIFGHSLGGIIAYELALRFQSVFGSIFKRLFVSACLPPTKISPDPTFNDMPDDDFLNIIKEYEGTPKQITANNEVIRFFLPRLKADFILFGSYGGNEEKVSVPITAFVGNNDPLVPVCEIQNWKFLTSNDFSYYVMGDGHFYYLTSSEALCRNILSILEEKS